MNENKRERNQRMKSCHSLRRVHLHLEATESDFQTFAFLNRPNVSETTVQQFQLPEERRMFGVFEKLELSVSSCDAAQGSSAAAILSWKGRKIIGAWTPGHRTIVNLENAFGHCLEIECENRNCWVDLSCERTSKTKNESDCAA